MLIEYVRQNGRAIGVVVATERNAIGWSKCCKRDVFNKERGLLIATGRANMGSKAKPPAAIKPYIEKMKDRAMRYYK